MLRRPCRHAFFLALLLVACGGAPGTEDGSVSGDAGPPTSDPCAPELNACPEPHRVCVPEGPSAICRCEPGYHEEGATCAPDGECLESTCTGHGTCELVDGAPACTCETRIQQELFSSNWP